MISTVPPFPPETMQCARDASSYYAVPQIVLLAIMKVEAGRPGMALLNKNGTYDYGRTGINTATIKVLEKQYNVQNATYMVKYSDCYNIFAGAWNLKRELMDAGVNHPDFWRRAGNYHSHTPKHNIKYQGLLYRAIVTISKSNWK